jgi:hypothetical protein
MILPNNLSHFDQALVLLLFRRFSAKVDFYYKAMSLLVKYTHSYAAACGRGAKSFLHINPHPRARSSTIDAKLSYVCTKQTPHSIVLGRIASVLVKAAAAGVWTSCVESLLQSECKA